ncbi:transglutaminase-like domain-containing protein [Pseudonocardia lacus]|uniref:transglutaminase-like domain-containing protein n=1 Tax=Pseudonocardia lacus TaxID=2835865 RepID=UPI001BDD46DB|nr:transglutaminase-like domain-containing protein [Pseudonocardia lacus]
MDAVARFAGLVERPDPPLDRAALAIAAGADPALDAEPWLAELDRLADGVHSLDDLLRRLFVERRFAGNTRDYTDPRNSLLDHVLRRRLGIPITLAVVAIEVGRRAGVALEGVGMPGHFLVRPTGTPRHLDVFAGGAELSMAECERLFRASSGTGRRTPFGPHLLATAPTTAILTRMLLNLRGTYRARRRPHDLEWVLRMRLALPGADLTDLLELAETLGDQGRWVEGARLLEERAETVTAARALQLRASARALRAHLN